MLSRDKNISHTKRVSWRWFFAAFLLAFLAGGAWVFLPPPQQALASEAPADEEAGDAGATDMGGAPEGVEDLTRSTAPNQQPLFVTIDNLHIPIIGDNGPEQMLSLIISLEVRDLATAENVRARSPRLSDAYMRALYASLYRGSIMNGQLVDVTKVKRKLERATLDVLGPGIVRNVLVQAVAQRRL